MPLTEVLGLATTATIILTRPKIMIIDHLKINEKKWIRKRAEPIKVSNPNNVHSTSRQQVVKGRGITTATAAIPQLRGK